MALPSWWTPFSYGGGGDDAQSQIELLNLLAPFLGSTEQNAAARYIYNQRAADPDLHNMVSGGYNRTGTGAAQSTDAWLQGLGGLAGALREPTATEYVQQLQGRGGMSSAELQRAYLNRQRQPMAQWAESERSLEGGVDTEWFKGLAGLASQLSPNSTRAQQRDARTAFDEYLGQAPSDAMQQMGSYLFDPYLTRPNYGQAALFGNYSQPYSVKGGLVSNPWYTG